MFAVAKRVFLMILVNILVMTTIMALIHFLGISPYMTAYGLDYGSLAAFCLIWGMGGSLISLLMSRMMAKWMMGVQLIDPNTRDPQEAALVQTVYRLARDAGLTTMPEVGVYASPEVNAFATGPSRSRSLVAVSSGLLQRLDKNAVEGVLGHEIAHVANGDMVTMTLLQGLVNAFVMFLARVIAFALSAAGRRDDRDGPVIPNGLLVFFLEMVLMLFGAMVVAWFSRYREYRADEGGARVAGRQKMIHALDSLRRTLNIEDPAADRPALQTFKISRRPHGGLFALFASHPPLEQRIERLQQATGV